MQFDFHSKFLSWGLVVPLFSLFQSWRETFRRDCWIAIDFYFLWCHRFYLHVVSGGSGGANPAMIPHLVWLQTFALPPTTKSTWDTGKHIKLPNSGNSRMLDLPLTLVTCLCSLFLNAEKPLTRLTMTWRINASYLEVWSQSLKWLLSWHRLHVLSTTYKHFYIMYCNNVSYSIRSYAIKWYHITIMYRFTSFHL